MPSQAAFSDAQENFFAMRAIFLASLVMHAMTGNEMSDDHTAITIRMPIGLREKIRAEATREERTEAQQIRKMLSDEFERRAADEESDGDA